MEKPRPLYLWLIEQDERTGYDTYDSAIVVAEDEAEARGMHPFSDRGDIRANWEADRWETSRRGGDWLECAVDNWTRKPSAVRARQLGVADDNMPAGLVLASYNAG